MNLSKATRECKNLQRYLREVRNEDGQTQLHYYCEHGMTSSVVRMLEMKSIDVEARERDEDYGWTSLMTAAWNGHLAICRLLIDKGAQLEAKDIIGRTPLHRAAMQGRVDIVRLLCNSGADVEARENNEERPLHWAVEHGHISIVKDLIEERNVEINARNDSGRTALRLAIRNDNLDMVAYLVSYGGVE